MMILIKLTSQKWSEAEQVEEDPMLTLAQKMELKLKREAEEAEKLGMFQLVIQSLQLQPDNCEPLCTRVSHKTSQLSAYTSPCSS